MEINLGDIVQLRKPHPCGSREWQVVRLGADIGLKCTGCQRRVLLERSVLERRIKSASPADTGGHKSVGRKEEIERELAELKAQWPAHSVKPWMWQKLEELEEELEQLAKEG